MTRIAMKTFAAVLFAATLGSAPVAAQKNPWEPGYLPTVMPSAKPESLPRDSATKISPFASKFAKDWPHLAPSQPSEWDRLGLGLKDGRVMDTKAFPNNRALVKSWVADFPNLGYDFEVLEAATRAAALCRSVAGKDSVPPGTYNCIAYTTGIKNVWLDPYQTVAGWDLYYGREFTRSKTLDVSLEVGLLKVAVYATTTTDGKAKCKHAALQHDDGTWSSKLGSGPLIRHRTAEAVCGSSYGEVVLVYVKKK